MNLIVADDLAQLQGNQPQLDENAAALLFESCPDERPAGVHFADDFLANRPLDFGILAATMEQEIRKGLEAELACWSDFLPSAYRTSVLTWFELFGLGCHMGIIQAIAAMRPSSVRYIGTRPERYETVRSCADRLGLAVASARAIDVRSVMDRLGLGVWRNVRAIRSKTYSGLDRRIEVLGFASHHSHQKAIEPVLTVLAERGWRVGMLYPAAYYLNRHVTVETVHEFALLERFASVRPPKIFRRRIGSTWFLGVLERSMREIEAAQLPLAGLARYLAFCFQHSLSQTSEFTASFLALMNRIAPKAVILPYQASHYVGILNAIAKQRGATTFEMLQGIPTLNTNKFLAGVSDTAFVWGQYTKNVLASLGAEPQRILPVGSPAWDSSLSKPRIACRPAMHSMGNVCYLTTPIAAVSITASQKRMFMRWLLDALIAHQNLHLLIKFHPGDSGEVERAAIQQAEWQPYRSRVQLMSRNANIVEAFERTDVVFTTYSTAAFEALLVEKPVLYYPLWINDPFLRELTARAWMVTATPDEFAQGLARLIGDQTFADFRRSEGLAAAELVFGPLDGRAAVRAADAIDRALPNGERRWNPITTTVPLSL